MTADTVAIQLREVGYARAGDKGDTSNVVVAVFDDRDYDWLVRHLTVSVVASHFGSLVQGEIVRYEMPGTKMLNFVMTRALQGGVSRSLNLDALGKSRASLMLGLRITCSSQDRPPSGRGYTG
jgi:hypothetical protein